MQNYVTIAETSLASATRLPMSDADLRTLWDRYERGNATHPARDSVVALEVDVWLRGRGLVALSTGVQALVEPVAIGTDTIRIENSPGGPVSRVRSASGLPDTKRFYVFHNLRRAAEYVAEQFVRFQEQTAAIEEQQASEAIVRGLLADWVNPYNVGDLLYRSQDDEETNFVFAQVVAVDKRSLLIRSIAARVIGGFASAGRAIAPVRDQFISKKPKRIFIRLRARDGRVFHYLPKWSPCDDGETFRDTRTDLYSPNVG